MSHGVKTQREQGPKKGQHFTRGTIALVQTHRVGEWVRKQGCGWVEGRGVRGVGVGEEGGVWGVGGEVRGGERGWGWGRGNKEVGKGSNFEDVRFFPTRNFPSILLFYFCLSWFSSMCVFLLLLSFCAATSMVLDIVEGQKRGRGAQKWPKFSMV